MNQIESLLRHTMGLHSATIGSSQVTDAVRQRMRSMSVADEEEYLWLLQRSPLEWSALVEAVVITETWFFRDPNSYAAMVRLVIEEWLPANPGGVLRLLSAPCSTGEEPYSMAMALMDTGLPADRFRIDAMDINERAVAFAQRGVYGRNSFRSADSEFRHRYFVPGPGGDILNPAVRRQVRFQAGNMLDDRFLKATGVYDIIFCRNLLIYFDRPAQNRTLVKLRRLLARTGVLFMGSAEVPLAVDNGFVPADYPLSFSCRKSDGAHKMSHRRQRLPRPALHAAPQSAQLPAARASAHSASSVQSSSPEQTPRPLTCLEQARQLADAGHLAEAAEICEANMREEGVSAEAFYLLGLVRDAAGADQQAGEFYRKALYLDPYHRATMHQWASLAMKKGDAAQAKLLRERAERGEKRLRESPSLWTH